MAHDTNAHSHLTVASSLQPLFSSMFKRAGDNLVDDHLVSAKSKLVRQLIAVKKEDRNADEINREVPQLGLESSGKPFAK